MIKAYIDGDWILYAAGFAGQKTSLVWFPENEIIGPVFGPNVTEIKALIAKDGYKIDEGKVYTNITVDPEAHVYHSAKHMIEGACDKIEKKFGEEVCPIVLMDGDGNFRSRIATIRPYKGTRHVHAKPLMYNNIRQYLLDNWGAEVVHGQETDDEMAIRQTDCRDVGDPSIIVSLDKDMLQVSGWHLNPNKGFKRVGLKEGRVRQYRQCITGDAVDNIGGAFKCGPKSAECITENMSERVMWNLVVDKYGESIDKHGNQYGGLSAEDAALENMRLVYLRRSRKQTWTPPGE